MKKISLLYMLISVMMITGTALAQVPQKFNYQGIARNNSGQPLANQDVSLRISLIDSPGVGVPVYSETHEATTNVFGLFSVSIGTGTPVSGIFSDINWGNISKFIKVEMDPTGGSTYTDLGTTALQTVPYAMYAANAPSVPAADSINGTTNTLIKFTGSREGGNSQFTDNGTSAGLNTPVLSPSVKFR